MFYRVTMQDISKKVGVSLTTVTKALNGKPKISEELRNRIIDTARELGYKPNKTAQALARNNITIGIVYPQEPHEFWCYLEDGMKKGIDDLQDCKVEGIFLPVKDLNSAHDTKKALNELYRRKVDGIILSVGFNYRDYKELVDFIEKDGIPVLFLLNDIQEASGIGCVKLNGVVAGRMAAQFLNLCLKEKRSVVIFTSNKELSIHRDCIKGFVDEADRESLDIKGIFETQDDKQIAHYLTQKVINEIPDLGGIYVSSYNSVSVCSCIEENNKQKEITIIGQDLYPNLVKKLENRTLKATLFQDPFEQGRISIKRMYRYLVEAPKQFGETLTTPQLVLSSNLECYKGKY